MLVVTVEPSVEISESRGPPVMVHCLDLEFVGDSQVLVVEVVLEVEGVLEEDEVLFHFCFEAVPWIIEACMNNFAAATANPSTECFFGF